MPGINAGFEIAKRAMLAHQAALNVFGHNIANVNTPGYTRQRAVLAPSLPLNVMPGALGTGVDLLEVKRVRNAFADRQFRYEKGVYGQLDTRSGVLTQIEGIFSEPSDSGVSALLDRFFNSFSDLSSQPNDPGARVAVQAAGQALAQGIRKLDQRLADYRASLNEEINLELGEVRRLLDEIAALNGEIATRTNTGLNPNDLEDRRDHLVDQVAELIGATAIRQSDGSVSLRLSGKSIVDRTLVTHLELQPRGQNDPVGAPILYADGSAAVIESGRIGALVELRDVTTEAMRVEIDVLARTLITQVNALHSQGLNGVDFFQGMDAATLSLSAAVASDPAAINSSRSGLSGDNDLAVELAELRSARVLAAGTATFSGFFRGLVSGIGAEKRAAEEGAVNQELAVRQVESERARSGGVNLDEEMAAMLTAQRAYEAAARVVTVMDGLMETVLTELGR
jgi:flagellar hook-associated protein 1 FlgK